MFKLARYLVLFLVSLLPMTSMAQADRPETTPPVVPFSITNLYDKALYFTVRPSDRDVAPDFPSQIASGDTARFHLHKIKLLGSSQYKPIYVRVVGESSDKVAFFSIEIHENTLQAHGYVDRGIAYTWKAQNPNEITFCTPAAYQQHNCQRHK